MGKKRLREILGILDAKTATPCVCVEGIPIDLAEYRERISRAFGPFLAGTKHEAPVRGRESATARSGGEQGLWTRHVECGRAAARWDIL